MGTVGVCCSGIWVDVLRVNLTNLWVGTTSVISRTLRERLHILYRALVVVGGWQLPDSYRNNRARLAQYSGRRIED